MSIIQYPTLTSLGDVSVETFLKEYWQQKPLFIKNAFPNFSSPIDANELAGFALEEDVNARLVEEFVNQKSHSHIDSQWKVTHAPLDENIFSTLPEHDWSLLVQHVDSLDPNVNALLNAFRFIPNWRLDDIMVSYAPDGGGVGPHFDYFDVFLLQAEGKREWKLGQWCDESSELIPDQPMKLLKEFHTHSTIEMQPGDLLYIPAKHAHWGKAIGESLTYSIGFRAPSHAEFLLDYAQELASQLGEDDRYRDTTHALRAHNRPFHNGEISHEAISVFQQNLHALVNRPELISRWLGEFSTQLKSDIDSNISPLSFVHLEQGNSVSLSPFCRAAYYDNSPDQALLFINGQSWQCTIKLAQTLSGYRQVMYSEYDGTDKTVIRELCELGWLEALS